jgi:hypothetical protein
MDNSSKYLITSHLFSTFGWYSFFFFFGNPGVWTQGLVLVRQALCHMNDCPGPLTLHILQTGGLDLDPLCFLPGWDDKLVSPHSAFTDWDDVSWTFCPGWPWTLIFLIFAPWVAKITGLGYSTWQNDLPLGRCSTTSQVPSPYSQLAFLIVSYSVQGTMLRGYDLHLLKRQSLLKSEWISHIRTLPRLLLIMKPVTPAVVQDRLNTPLQ